jgi:Domain of unknown function (DUF4260)
VEALSRAIARKIGELTQDIQSNSHETRRAGFMFRKPGVLLRVEGLVVFTLSLFCYRELGAPWSRFVLLFLVPDLFMVGYFISVRTGSQLYNLAHTYIFPLGLASVALYEHRAAYLTVALIWIAHIGGDRALGYGLKYPTFFKDTHLQRVDEPRLACGNHLA